MSRTSRCKQEWSVGKSEGRAGVEQEDNEEQAGSDRHGNDRADQQEM